MKWMLETALANPWDTLRTILDGPLHPGGREATEALLDRAGVAADTRLVDVGCGTGESLAVARDRGATTIGVDRDPGGTGTVRGEMTQLPIQNGGVDIVLAECVMCLAADRKRALAEARRVLEPGGTLALSDIVAEGAVPALPEPVVRALCLQNSRSRVATVAGIEEAGFEVETVQDHREDLLAMREQVAETINYEAMLPLMGERGSKLLDGIHHAERAVDDGRISYVASVAVRAD